MFALRTNETVDQTKDPSGSIPSTNPDNIGAGFVHQTLLGTWHTDTFDDRVTYEADIHTQEPMAQTIGLGNDLDAAGAQASVFSRIRQALNPTRQANIPPRTQVDAVIQNDGNGGSYSEEQWRPYAGFPLSGTSDTQWSRETDDINGSGQNTEGPFLQGPGERRMMEKADDIPTRYSGYPSQVQAWRPWDTVMGTFPWTGEKSAQRSPIAAQPFNTDGTVHDAQPSPTGAGGPVDMTNELETHPLTFRTAPSPWDIGTDGAYVDSGV